MWPPVDPPAGREQLESPHPLTCTWNVCSAHNSHCRSLFQGHSLERARCCWDNVNCTCDWTQLQPLYKLLWCCCVGTEIYLSCEAQDKPLSKPATYQSGVACLFFPSLLALLVRKLKINVTDNEEWKSKQFWYQFLFHCVSLFIIVTEEKAGEDNLQPFLQTFSIMCILFHRPETSDGCVV